MKKKSKLFSLLKQRRYLLYVMGNFYLFLMLLTLNVSASVASLGQMVSLNMNDATLEECIKSIENQSELGFFYNARQIKKVKGIDISMEQAPVSEVLDELLEETNLCYEIENSVILIKNRPNYRKTRGTKSPIVKESVQQKKVLRGKVTDENGVRLPGVSIVIKGTTTGVATDVEGKYELKLDELEGTLIISFIGMQSQQILIKGQANIDVVLVSSTSELDEIVAVGYGSAKKKDLTGSVVRIASQAIEKSTFTDVGQLMQGQVAGMEVLSGSGRPGEQVRIRIRGESSFLGDANPLIVIDEIPMPDNYDINLINPNDIKSIDILKGASAAAIYRAKGSAGVILISTRQGGEGTAEVFYTGTISTKGYVDDMITLEGDDFRKASMQSFFGQANWYKSTFGKYGYNFLDLRTNWGMNALTPGYFEEASTNWQDVMTQTPINMNHNLGIRGGNKQASYYASFGYIEDKGRVIGNGNDRITAQLNLDLRPTSWFEMGFRFSGAKSNTTSGQTMDRVMQARPDVPVYNEDGSYYRYWSPGHKKYRDNPLQLSIEAPTLRNSLSYTTSGYGRIVFSENLRYQITASWSENRGESRDYNPSYTYSGSGSYGGGVYGILNTGTSYSNQANIDNGLHYTKTTEKHDISIMVGTTFNQDKDGNVNHNFQDFPDDYIQNVAYNATKWNSTSGRDDASAYFSVYGRGNYKFNDRYLLTATIRRDASSKFAPAHRVGIFPSVAGGWVISEENFMQSKPLSLSFLKLRVGYGVTGNDRIGRYAWRSNFGSTDYFDRPGTYPVSIGNDQVRWEETTQLDLGLDFGFWHNRIFGSIGYYDKFTDGLLFGYTLAPSAGLTNIKMNFAEITNKGLEFDIRVKALESRKWSLTCGFNIANNKGKVLKLNRDIVGDAEGNDPGYYATTVLKEGEPIGLIYGYRVIPGQFDPDKGSYVYKDFNDDGKIENLNDREVLGNSVPDFFGGFSVDLRYKRFSARLAGKFSYGAQKHWTGLQDAFHMNVYNPDNVNYLSLYSYSPNNPNSNFQAMGAGWEKYISDTYLYDASYMKLSDFRVGYDLPDKLVKKAGLSSVNVFGAVNNIFTFTTYPGTNVETYSSNPIQGAGLDYSIYPQIRNFIFGVKVMLR